MYRARAWDNDERRRAGCLVSSDNIRRGGGQGFQAATDRSPNFAEPAPVKKAEDHFFPRARSAPGFQMFQSQTSRRRMSPALLRDLRRFIVLRAHFFFTDFWSSILEVRISSSVNKCFWPLVKVLFKTGLFDVKNVDGTYKECLILGIENRTYSSN